MPSGSTNHRRQNYYFESPQVHRPRTRQTPIQHFHMLRPAIQTAEKNLHPSDFPVIERSGCQLELPLKQNDLRASCRCLPRAAVFQRWLCALRSNEPNQILTTTGATSPRPVGIPTLFFRLASFLCILPPRGASTRGLSALRPCASGIGSGALVLILFHRRRGALVLLLFNRRRDKVKANEA